MDYLKEDNISPSDLSDEKLVALSLENPDNFAYLIERYRLKLSIYIKRLTSISDDDLDDLLQEVFIKIYSNLNGFDVDLKFSSWVYRITHNQVVSNYRKLKARPEGYKVAIDDFLLNNLAAEIDPKKEVDKQFLKNKISLILQKMKPKFRELMVLRFLEEKSYQEISDILKKPSGTVASLMNKAKKDFKTVALEQNLRF